MHNNEQVSRVQHSYEKGRNITSIFVLTILQNYQLRCGPYIGQNLPKVGSRYCPHGILHVPPKVDMLQGWKGEEWGHSSIDSDTSFLSW